MNNKCTCRCIRDKCHDANRDASKFFIAIHAAHWLLARVCFVIWLGHIALSRRHIASGFQTPILPFLHSKVYTCLYAVTSKIKVSRSLLSREWKEFKKRKIAFRFLYSTCGDIITHLLYYYTYIIAHVRFIISKNLVIFKYVNKFHSYMHDCKYLSHIYRVVRVARNMARWSSWNAARLIPGSLLPFPAQIAQTVRSLQVPTQLHFGIFDILL